MTKNISTKRPMFAYCHMGKVGGKRLSFYLYCHFGARHLMVEPSIKSGIYSAKDLRQDLNLLPWVESIGGHMLRPYADFSGLDRELLWYTMLRDPIERAVCHYQQQFTSGKRRCLTFRDWLDKYPGRAHWQTSMLAGEDDINAAKQVLTEKFAFVGINEYYEESLFMMSYKLGWNNFRFFDGRSYRSPDEPESEDGIREEIKNYRPELEQRFASDIELYNYGKNQFNNEIANFGQDRLEQELKQVFHNSTRLTKLDLNRFSGRLTRNLIYKPYTRLRQCTTHT